MKKIKPLLLLVVSITLLIALILPGCSNSGTVGADGKVSVNLSPDKDQTIGDAAKMGWQMDILSDTFDEPVDFTMNVLDESESETYYGDEFLLIQAPMKVQVSGQENMRLNQPVRVTVRLPEEQMDNIAPEELFYAYFYDGKWEYYMPDSIDMKEGAISFDAYHFSILGCGVPSEEEQIEAYAQAAGVQEWINQNNKQKFIDATGQYYDDLFSSIGVKSKAAREQFTVDMISYMENSYIDSSGISPIDALTQMSYAASKGEAGKQDLQNKLLEFTGKALIRVFEKDPSAFSQSVNVIGNLSTAAGALSEGDEKAALESVATMLKGAVPAAALADAVGNYVKGKIEDGIDYWTMAEIEKAYQAYTTGVGKYGYSPELKGDFDTIFTLMGGGDRQLNIKIIRNFCEKYGIDESELNNDPERRNQIIDKAKEALKKHFQERMAAEAEMKKITDDQDVFVEQEKAFIGYLKDEGLLSPYNYRDYFGIEEYGRNFDIKHRLDRLYNIKNLVLGVMDKDQAESITDEFLVRAIKQWVYWNEQGDREGFYQYMREMGYITDPVPSPGYGWVQINVIDEDAKDFIETQNKNYAGIYENEVSYGKGVFSHTWTYVGESDDYYDPPQMHGETISWKASFSELPEVIKGGEEVSIDVTLAPSGIDLSFFTGSGFVKANYSKNNSAWKCFVNENGEDSFRSYSKNGYPSISETIKATMPAGREGDILEVQVLMSSGPKMATIYVYEWKEL